MAKHRQTATGRKETVGRRTKAGTPALEVRAASVREINLVRTAGTPLSAVSSAYASRAPSPVPRAPFRFFDLPSELRIRIYQLALRTPSPVDLDSSNYRNILPRLNLFLVSHRMHDESYHVFYGQTIRLFPHRDAGRFYNTKKPLLQRLPVKYREAINCMEVRLGSGWSKPPACQNTWNEELGLSDCKNFRRLKVFIECDPSDNIFAGFRGKGATEETYSQFCVDLLLGIIHKVPSLDTVEIDAYEPVKKDAPLVVALVRQVRAAQKKLIWGASREWGHETPDLADLMELVSDVRSMSLLPNASRVVGVEA